MSIILRRFSAMSFPVVVAVAVVCAAHLPAMASQQIDVVAPRAAVTASPTLMAAEAVLAHRGFDETYAMSSGRPMAVAMMGSGLEVRYGRQRPTMLRHDGNGRFVSHDQQLSLAFELDAGGQPSAVRLTMPASRQ